MGSRLEPRAVWTSMAVFLSLMAVVALSALARGERLGPLANILLSVSTLAANLVSAQLGRRIALEHEEHTPMRLAWNLVAAGMLANAARSGFELAFQATGRLDSALYIALGLRQVLIAASLLLLAGALVAMWSSFSSLALGVRLRALDWALMGCILLLVPPVVWSRQAMADAGSPLVVVRYLQFASPFLLAVPAAMGVVLYRVSREMGEGLMAIALKCLAASFAIRLLALVVGTSVGPSAKSPAVVILPSSQMLLTIAAHWAFLLGLVYRLRLSRATTDLIESYKSDQDRQLALLAAKKNAG